MSDSTPGRLHVVATPIGNLGDLSPRALETLRSVDAIAAEDTRHTQKLLAAFGARGTLIALHDHNEAAQSAQLVARMLAGDDIALVSDAGTPLISDPGYRLVALARQAGIEVVPVPGACAAIAALSASGLPSDRFSFEGFPPAKSSARKDRFSQLLESPYTLIFYESPHRIVASLTDMLAIFGPERRLVMAREISKTFETFLTGTTASVLDRVTADPNQQKGEIVLLVEGFKPPDGADGPSDEARRVMRILLDAQLPLKQAAGLAATIAADKKNRLYEWALAQRAE